MFANFFHLGQRFFFSYLIALHRFVYDYTNRSTPKKTDSILKYTIIATMIIIIIMNIFYDYRIMFIIISLC